VRACSAQRKHHDLRAPEEALEIRVEGREVFAELNHGGREPCVGQNELLDSASFSRDRYAAAR
jgi:hypothetical protein